MPAVLVTLGRLPIALDLIRSFHALGWRVIVADPYRTHLSKVSRAVHKSVRVPSPYKTSDAYRAALLDIVRQEQVDLVLPVSEDILYVSQMRDELPQKTRLLAMPHDRVARVHDKYEFIRLASSFGLRVPDTALARTDEAERLAAQHDFVIKPRHSCAGYGVSLHRAGTPFVRRADAIVQRAVSGAEVSTCALADQGRVIAQAIYRATLHSGTVAIGFERIENPAIDEWVARFVAATGWSGFISFDFISDDEGAPSAIECNPRTTSGLHFFETADIAKAIINPDHPLAYRREMRLIQFWSVMQHLSDHVGALSEMRRALSHLVKIRDVTFAWRDPLPLLAMPWTAQEIMQAAKRDRVPFGIAATRDFLFPPEGDHDAA